MVVSSKEPERGSVGSSVSELGTEERRESGLGESGTVEVGLNSVVCVFSLHCVYYVMILLAVMTVAISRETFSV